MHTQNPSKEVVFSALSGYFMLLVTFALLAGAILITIHAGREKAPEFLLASGPMFLAFVLSLPGYFTVEPNQARVLVLFGKYRGSVRKSGFFWTNPFTMKKKISLRAHNLNGKPLKVNDLLGNPIEIAAIAVWQVRDTAQATFDVEAFEHFVEVQSESAVRLVASRHPYDDGQTAEASTTLRGSSEVVARELGHELQQRLALAGIDVIETRLSHLAYAPEIAAAMLQRQQASAIIAARKLIVDGAVGMVEMALEKLAHNKVVELDAERRATLTGNLLVVLCGQTAPTPVLNTGSLYT